MQGVTEEAALRNNTIVLVGDEKQLPPVCSHRDVPDHGICSRCHIAANPIFRDAWQSASRRLRLDVNHRNPDFAHALETIRNQHEHPLSQEWVDEHINKLVRDLPPHELTNATTLHSLHKDVNSTNAAAMDSLEQQGHEMRAVPPYLRRQLHAEGAGLEAVQLHDLCEAQQRQVSTSLRFVSHCLCPTYAPACLPSMFSSVSLHLSHQCCMFEVAIAVACL